MASADELSHVFDSVVGTVTLRASDLGRQRNFYEQGIGLTTSSEGAAVAELRGAGAHPLVRLDSAAAAGAEPVRVPHTGLFHTAFRYPDRASLAAAVVRTSELAREFQGASDHGVSEAIYFADPEGNGIELYRDRPVDEWPEGDEPGKVGMFTARLDLPALLEEAASAGTESEPDIGHIHLMTADASSALSFWRDVVGLDERQRFGPSAVFLAEGYYHHHIGANTWHSAGAGPAPSDRPGLEAFELRVRDAAFIEAARDRLGREGVAAEEDEESIAFRDVDSNLVTLTIRG